MIEIDHKCDKLKGLFTFLRNFHEPCWLVITSLNPLTAVHSTAMKPKLFFISRRRSWLALSPLCISIVVAQTPPAEQPPGDAGMQKMKQMMIAAIKKADINHDGVLDKSEFITLERISRLPADKQDKLFERIDKNHDQLLQPNEFPPKGGDHEMMRRRIIPHLRELDINNDMAISKEEFLRSPMIEKLPKERQDAIFKMMDRDGDGKLTPLDRPDGPPEAGPDDPERRNNKKNRPGKPENRPFSDDSPPGMPINDAVIDRMDTNHDGRVDFTEFRQSAYVSSLGEDEQEDRFQQIDTDKNHQLSREELTNGLRFLGRKAPMTNDAPPGATEKRGKMPGPTVKSAPATKNQDEMQDSEMQEKRD